MYTDFFLKVGLLPRSMPEQIPFAYKLYKDNTRKGYELSKGFKQTFSSEIKIDFVGVWYAISLSPFYPSV